MNLLIVSVGIFLTFWGTLSVYVAITRKVYKDTNDTMVWQSYEDSFILRIIAGKSFNKIHNLLYGLLSLSLGLIILGSLIKQSL